MTHCNQSSTPKTIAVALLIIVAGVLFLLDGIGVIPYELSRIFISWQMLLIVIGIFNLLSSQHKVTGLILIAIGGVFMYAKLFGLQYNAWSIIWPTVLIVIGISILYSHNRKGRKAYHQIGEPVDDNADTIDEVSIFSGSEKIITSQNFRGGKVVSIFGGTELDFTKAQLSDGKNEIEIFYTFGGSTMIVPPDWEIKIEVTSVFGGFSDKRYKTRQVMPETDKTLVIKGLVIFGGGEIKSY